MKKKRIIFSLLGLGLVAATLASCGKEKEDAKDTTTSEVINTSTDTTTQGDVSTTTTEQGGNTTTTTTEQGGNTTTTTTEQGGNTTTTTIEQGGGTTTTTTEQGGNTTTTSEETEPVIVSFNSNSNIEYDDFEVGSDGKVAKPATDPTKAEDSNNTYNFVCWCKDEALTKAFDFDNDVVTASTTLYAKYSIVSKDTAIKMNGVEYATIKAALEAIPVSGDTSTYTITVPKGTYHENGLLYAGSATVRIVGNTDTKYGSDVVIIGHGDDMTQSRTRNTLSINGSGDVILENITLKSDWRRNDAAQAGIKDNTQAEVLGTSGTGNTVCYNCSFISHQDTLRTVGKAWFYGCYVEGDTDFLWMEESGKVALYEKCEIVSVTDDQNSTKASYCTAPRMAVSNKINKGLVIYNSVVRESDAAKAAGQATYLARSPWISGAYNQVAYINTQINDVTNPWYGNSIPCEHDRTDVGWKMDRATAASFNYAGSNDILSDEKVQAEYAGRRNIINRLYNVGKLKYEKDTANVWDIDSVIEAYSYLVDEDTSKDFLDGEVVGDTTTYLFDGEVDYSSLCDRFIFHENEGNKHYVGDNGATITIPVSGKCYVEVYGYYSGTAEIVATGQGESIISFNNSRTDEQVLNTYIVFNENAENVVITAKATTYITKIVVTTDSSITETKVEGITISRSTNFEYVDLEMTLSASITNAYATNKTIKWSSSNETIGKIDELSGKVTFLKAGSVTFTATACDGSGKSQSITCSPKVQKWNEAEWFTTDSALNLETEAINIGEFELGTLSVSKSLGSSYSFSANSGTKNTTYGLKFDSKGFLKIATVKQATLTLIVANIGNREAAPSVKTDDATATLLSKTVNDNSTFTYVYRLATKGTWTIERGDGQTENNPLIYARVSYDAMWNFKDNLPKSLEGTNIEGKTGTISSNYGITIKLTVDATNGKFAWVASEDGNYMQFDKGTIIKVQTKVGEGAVLTVVSCQGQSNYTVNGQEADDVCNYTITQEDVTRGYVEIVATADSGIYSISCTKMK